MSTEKDCGLAGAENDDVAQRITRALGNYSDTADVTWVARFPAERIARALGLDPAMPMSVMRVYRQMTRAEAMADDGWDGSPAQTDNVDTPTESETT